MSDYLFNKFKKNIFTNQETLSIIGGQDPEPVASDQITRYEDGSTITRYVWVGQSGEIYEDECNDEDDHG